MKEIEALAECKKRVTKYVPSTSQIAHVAAILANGNPIASDHPLAIADEAIKLWDACESMRRVKIDELAESLREAEKTFSELGKQNLKPIEPIEVSKPKKYPVGLDELLRLTLPKKRTEERMKIYREHLRTGLAPDGNTVIHRSDEEIAELIGQKRIRKFNEEQFEVAANGILHYLPHYEADNRRKRAKAGAAGLAKKRAKKNDSAEK